MAVDAVMTPSAQRRILGALAGFGTADVAMAPLTTYRVGGPASVLAAPRNVEELRTVGRVALAEGVPLAVVGRGSNLLVADRGFAGIVVVLAELIGAERIELAEPEHGSVVVEAGAAVPLPVLARRTVAAGLVGFEWAVGVPGSIGGAVRMNAGGHGSDMAATLVSAEVVDLVGDDCAWRPSAALGLRFRASDLTDREVVVAARLRLAFDPARAVTESEETLAEIVRWRREHQPGGQNAGSVFVNPVPGQLAAAQVIDGLGLRGTRIGGAHVSEKHANFIQADDGATAEDVRAVMEFVRRTVAERTGIRLRSEIRLLGFDDDTGAVPSPRRGGRR